MLPPEKWARVTQIFESALETEPQHRDQFVEEACAGDEELRREVDSLLEAHEEAGDFIESPPAEAFQVAQGLGTGPSYERLGPYRLLERVGSGGMGAVYRAERDDEEFRKQVAIKIVSRGLNTEFILRRFRQERQILAGLNHPNITMLLDGGATPDGLPYFVMEFVEGKPILAYCEDRELSIRERLVLFRTVCAAVQYAHKNHVVHRDLKPSNILVTAGGIPKLLDFGIAKMLEPGTGEGAVEQTISTRGLMTPEYASPEQVRGEPATPASDIYSLGVLLYEMLTQRRPYGVDAPTPQKMAEAVCRQEPEKPSRAVTRPKGTTAQEAFSTAPPETGLARKLRGDLDNIVMKAMRKEPERRYASAQDLSEDIRRHLEGLPVLARKGARTYRLGRFVGRHKAAMLALVLGIVLLVVAGTMTTRWLRKDTTTGGVSAAAIRSIAVLPLANLSSDPEQQYFADGMTDALITDLAQIQALRVISRTSAMQYKGTSKRLPEIASELKVEGVVEGSVLRWGDRVRVTVQLIHAPTDRHLWARSYERELRDVLQLQGDVSQAIAKEIEITLSPASQARRRSVDPVAYQLYLKGWYHLHEFTLAGLQKGVEYFQQAIEKDPTCALAYSGLSMAYSILGVNYLPPKDAMPKAKAAAMKALQLDDSLAEAHAGLASVHLLYEWDWQRAGLEVKRALELSPSCAGAHTINAYYLELMGKSEETLVEVNRANELDPLSSVGISDVGIRHYIARRYDQAIELYLKVAETDPLAHHLLVMAYECKGMYSQAIGEYQKLMSLSGDREGAAALGEAYARLGYRAALRQQIKAIEVLVTRSVYSPWDMGGVHAFLGDKDQAFAWLERAYRERTSRLPWIKVDPRFDPLRSDPRFQDLLRRMNLAS